MDKVDPPTSASAGGSRAEDWARLVVRVAESRDKEAFTILFDHFAPRIEAHLQRLGLDAAQAEEIAQDVMITLWRKASLFDPSKSACPPGSTASRAIAASISRAATARIMSIRNHRRSSKSHPKGRSTRPSTASSATISCAGSSPNSERAAEPREARLL